MLGEEPVGEVPCFELFLQSLPALLDGVGRETEVGGDIGMLGA